MMVHPVMDNNRGLHSARLSAGRGGMTPRTASLCGSGRLLPRSVSILIFFFFLMIRRPPRFTLFPYTPPFRSIRLRNALTLVRTSAIWAALACVLVIRRVLLRSDRKSTRLNSSHLVISYAVFCLKKKKKKRKSAYMRIKEQHRRSE